MAKAAVKAKPTPEVAEIDEGARKDRRLPH
jgi:hypothetical protein